MGTAGSLTVATGFGGSTGGTGAAGAAGVTGETGELLNSSDILDAKSGPPGAGRSIGWITLSPRFAGRAVLKGAVGSGSDEALASPLCGLGAIGAGVAGAGAGAAGATVGAA